MPLITIPPMTHELSRGWDRQPNPKDILIDDKHALMSKANFDLLKDYSYTNPSGVYEGKMWKSQSHEVYLVTEGEHKGKYRKGPTYGKWFLNWWDFSDEPDKCSHGYREILIVDI